jgi:CubicO group peptidase (beta-lactamase class C family)
MTKLANLKYLLILIFTSFLEMPSIAQFHKQLASIAEENKLIGMSLVVVSHGKVKDVYHFGKSNIERNTKVDDSTMFRVASISKTVTTTALMKLYEKKSFKLDDDISPYLGFKVVNPYFPDKVVTFRMLMSHTSSLLDGEAYDKFLMDTYQQNPPPPLKKLLLEGGEYYSKSLWNNREPGTYFSYCNLNFGIMGTLIEKISGKRFDIFIKENITGPLGIQGNFNVCNIKNINKLATLYRNSEPQTDNFKGLTPNQRDLTEYKIGDNGIIYGPQGGFRISALDLSKFMTMLMNDGEYRGIRILDSTTIALMHSCQWKYNGTNGDNENNLLNEWGLGFHLITNTENADVVIKNLQMIGHTGEAYGLLSSMFFDKASQFGFVFMINGYYGENGYTKPCCSAFYRPEAELFDIIGKYYGKHFAGTYKKNGKH